MRKIIKDDILSMLKKVIVALKEKDFSSIGELSNHIIHDASIFQEDDSLSLAVLVYALSKYIHRCIEKQKTYTPVYKQLQKAHDALMKDDLNAYRSVIKRILVDVGQCGLLVATEPARVGQVLERAERTTIHLDRMGEEGLGAAPDWNLPRAQEGENRHQKSCKR